MPPLSYEELDHRPTPIGELLLRRRRLPGTTIDVHEILLDGAFLMSSLVNESERLLASIPLAAARDAALDVLVGGLGLGYTAAAALEDDRVRSVMVVERLAAVVDWHRQGLLPLGSTLHDDARCTLVEGDFFARLRQDDGERFDAILVDIDHSPHARLSSDHSDFYEPEGLGRVRDRLREGGVFALWSADAPDAPFADTLRGVFADVRSEEVRFYNPLADADEVNTIYVAR